MFVWFQASYEISVHVGFGEEPHELIHGHRNFKNGDAVAVYRRFRERGRLVPRGLSYVSSWVNETLDRCWQLMEPQD
jgi:hypothetical protein